MKTNTHPGDYERRVKIVPQLERLCVKCGGHVLLHPDQEFCCVKCGSENDYVFVMETSAENFRALLNAEQDASPDSLSANLDAAGYGSAGPM